MSDDGRILNFADLRKAFRRYGFEPHFSSVTRDTVAINCRPDPEFRLSDPMDRFRDLQLFVTEAVPFGFTIILTYMEPDR